MAAIPVVIVGTIKDKDSTEEREVTITGLASIQGLTVGGGPIIPQDPVHIWGGGNVPMPTPPIQLPPWLITGGRPPQIWGPPGPWIGWWVPGAPGAPGWTPPGGGGNGEHEPKFEWKTGWTPETGWVVVAIPLFEHVTPSAAPSAEGQQ